MSGKEEGKGAQDSDPRTAEIRKSMAGTCQRGGMLPGGARHTPPLPPPSSAHAPLYPLSRCILKLI